MKALFAAFSLLLITATAHAESFLIPLNDIDQSRLAKTMSNVDYRKKTEEIVNADRPDWHVLKTYFILDSNSAVSLHCSEEFHQGSTIGIRPKCQVSFDYKKNSALVSAKDGFVPELAVATITDSSVASVLFGALKVGGSASFSSKEQVFLVNPRNGQKFGAFRLRMECTKDSCSISAVK